MQPGQLGESLLGWAMEKLGLSARCRTQVLSVARTVADFAGSHSVRSAHLAEAIQYVSMRRRASGARLAEVFCGPAPVNFCPARVFYGP
ncbi:MAG TPA: hypothetical protein VLB76_16965 [Thermoanaerobaculia bacterium]|jgi:magnesium chelatase family protein|nr:hypothetical protein [Thermoanaerobaculia bacterium]